MKISAIILPALSGLLIFGSVGAPAPAKADTTSTVLIAAGAAAIVGALLYDSNNHPYYVRENRRYYVTQDEANYYREHHRGYVRQAYVPEREYPVARSYNDRNREYHDYHNGYGH